YPRREDFVASRSGTAGARKQTTGRAHPRQEFQQARRPLFISVAGLERRTHLFGGVPDARRTRVADDPRLSRRTANRLALVSPRRNQPVSPRRREPEGARRRSPSRSDATNRIADHRPGGPGDNAARGDAVDDRPGV